MQEKIEYKGEWFLPKDRNKRVMGILTYSPDDGCTLELLGSFYEDVWVGLKDELIILGLSRDSKEITLYQCMMIEAGGMTLVSDGESGIPTNTYRANYLLEGVHAGNAEDLRFDKMVTEIDNLGEWIGVSGFSPRKLKEELDSYELNVHYKLPDPIKFQVNDQWDGHFNFIVNHPSHAGFQKNISINQRVQFILASKAESSLEDLLKLFFQFQNFLVLALYHPTYPTKVSLYRKDSRVTLSDDTVVPKRIILHFAVHNRFESVKKSERSVLFSYRHIEDEFPVIIKNWYLNYETLESAINLVLEQFYNNERFTENTFLNLAQAAEAFHARTNDRPRIPKADYDKMKDEICASTPSKYHAWLNDQFNFGNSLNLHARLMEIVTKYSNETLDQLIGDKESFVKQVKHARNYYTHYSASSKKHALKGQSLFFLTEKLKVVLVCAFLIEVGFDNEKLNKLLERNRQRFFPSFSHV